MWSFCTIKTNDIFYVCSDKSEYVGKSFNKFKHQPFFKTLSRYFKNLVTNCSVDTFPIHIELANIPHRLTTSKFSNFQKPSSLLFYLS